MKSEHSDKIDDIARETLTLANEMAEQLAANDSLQAELDKVQAEFNAYFGETSLARGPSNWIKAARCGGLYGTTGQKCRDNR